MREHGFNLNCSQLSSAEAALQGKAEQRGVRVETPPRPEAHTNRKESGLAVSTAGFPVLTLLVTFFFFFFFCQDEL